MVPPVRTRAHRRGLRNLTAQDLISNVTKSADDLRLRADLAFQYRLILLQRESPATSAAGLFVWVIKYGRSPGEGKTGPGAAIPTRRGGCGATIKMRIPRQSG